MTNKEAKEKLYMEWQKFLEDNIDYAGISEAYKTAFKALEQEPCEDEYIKVPKKALKYRTAGMVAYNAEWLKNHFDIERAVICGAQEPCGDAISRQAVLDLVNSDWKYEGLETDVASLPPVNPQPKTGYWITTPQGERCSNCLEEFRSLRNYSYCPNCGCRMVEPQESEGNEISKCRYDLSEDCHNRDCLVCTLDKIRAEIKEHADRLKDSLYGDGMRHCIDIIDKYKAESEVRNE